MIQVKIEDFLAKFVEGYLFADVTHMEGVKADPASGYGALIYPMVATTLSGVELLGALLSSTKFEASAAAGNTYFKSYWEDQDSLLLRYRI